MNEYLDIYERVKPDLKAIDKMFGSSEPNEPQPYSSDMAAAHDELKVLANAVTAAEKASPNAIAPQGAEAIKLGRSIWALAEAKTNRELARAWLSWALPDRCDTTAPPLTEKSALLGRALKYNTPSPTPSDAPAAAPAEPASPPASEPPAQSLEATTPPAPTGASVDSILTSPPPPSPAPATQDFQTPPPTAAPTAPGGEASPEVAPPPSAATVPQNQPDPNAPIPDPTTPKP